MKTPPPTARQLEVHAWMRTYQFAWGMPPTTRELMTAFSWKSTNSAASMLTALVKKGLCRHRPNTTRAWLALPIQEGTAT